jgi:hypothetical protein
VDEVLALADAELPAMSIISVYTKGFLTLDLSQGSPPSLMVWANPPSSICGRSMRRSLTTGGTCRRTGESRSVELHRDRH